VYIKFTGNITEGMKLGRMIGHTENYIIKTAPKLAKFEEESAPAPEPLPTLSLSHHNHTLIHNTTHHGLTLSSRRIHFKVKQTNIR